MLADHLGLSRIDLRGDVLQLGDLLLKEVSRSLGIVSSLDLLPHKIGLLLPLEAFLLVLRHLLAIEVQLVLECAPLDYVAHISLLLI